MRRWTIYRGMWDYGVVVSEGPSIQRGSTVKVAEWPPDEAAVERAAKALHDRWGKTMGWPERKALINDALAALGDQ